jgi:undecaprenyl-phosphate galactose phosphotransferase
MKTNTNGAALTSVSSRLSLGMLRSFVLMAAQIGLDMAIYWACVTVTAYFQGTGSYGLGFERKIFFSGVIFICFFFNSLYRFKSWVFWDEMREVLKSSITAVAVIVVYIFAMKIQLSRILVFASAAFFAPACIFARYLFRRAAAAVGLLKTPVLILGAGKAGELYAKKVAGHPFMGCKVMGFLDDDPAKTGSYVAGIPVLGKLENFANVQSEVGAEEAVIAISTASRELLAHILEIVEMRVKRVSYIPDMYMLTTFSASIRDIDGLPLISASQGLLNPWNRMIKSAMDYVGAILALILFSPVFLYAAWRIKRGDGGDVFFSQTCSGQLMKPFRMHKFRTMLPNAESILEEMLKNEKIRHEFEVAYKLKDDPRITRVGGFLRKSSLDELPQLFNVIKGEMSLVGPRPIHPRELKLYYNDSVVSQLSQVKPGITGLWQVSGRSEVDYQERLQLNLYYVLNWSPWLDIVIMLRTIQVLFNRNGAY